MNLRIITKNHAADSEIGFLTKSVSNPQGRETAMPPAWELKTSQDLITLMTVDSESTPTTNGSTARDAF